MTTTTKTLLKKMEKSSKEVYASKGVSALMEEVNFSFSYQKSYNNNNNHVIKKAIQAIRRPFKKHFEKLNTNKQRVKFLEELSGEHIQVKVEAFSPKGDEEKDVEKILKNCRPKKLRLQKDELEMARITIFFGGTEQEVFGILNSEATSSVHGTRRYYPQSERKAHMYVDVATLISEVIFVENLESYIEKNREIYDYEAAKFIASRSDKNEVPTDPELREKYLAVAIPQGWVDEKEMEDSEWMNTYRSILFPEEKMTSYDGATKQPSFHAIIRSFVRDMGTTKALAKERKEVGNTARAFETKKHIPEVYQERMKTTPILNFYGYVEIDSDVCLEKELPTFEKELNELKKQFPVPQRDDYSMRIRKLGRHKAAGIFFPGMKNTVIDPASPQAFGHEMFHQIDHILSETTPYLFYSDTVAFRPVMEKYIELVERNLSQLPEDHHFFQQWNGKTKYNRDYYFRPTEIFARCGEIYLNQFLKDSMLVSDLTHEEDTIYPQDPELLQMLQEHFESLLKQIPSKKPKTKGAKKKLAKPARSGQPHLTTREEINNPAPTMQLSLF